MAAAPLLFSSAGLGATAATTEIRDPGLCVLGFSQEGRPVLAGSGSKDAAAGVLLLEASRQDDGDTSYTNKTREGPQALLDSNLGGASLRPAAASHKTDGVQHASHVPATIAHKTPGEHRYANLGAPRAYEDGPPSAKLLLPGASSVRQGQVGRVHAASVQLLLPEPNPV